MEESKSSSTAHSENFLSSSPMRFEKLIHIPLSTKIIDSLVNLFNYLDIYGPKMPLVYDVVSIFRFFQLMGGSTMAANKNSFKPGTLAYETASVLTILFHILPVKYRRGSANIMQFVIDGILLSMAAFLIFTAFRYKFTSKVPAISTMLLSIFMAIGPFLLLPVAVQFQGQNISGLIRGISEKNAQNIVADALTGFTVFLWLWIIISAYTKSIVFRPCSLPAVQGKPQTKLIITSTAVTFITSLTTYSNKIISAVCLITGCLLYVYCATTVFRCGTFIKSFHQILILSGCIIGMFFCIGSFYPLFTHNPWGPDAFLIFGAFYIVICFCCYYYIKNRQKRELRLLDEIEETNDISVITPGKFKQMTVTGFTFCHPLCLSFKLFKLAIEEWRDELDVFCIYTKFLSIYPEQESQLAIICQSIATMKTNNKILQRSTLASAANILKTRETSLTTELKSKISKLQKVFVKAKNKLRNCWDLILQGNIVEMHQAIKQTKPLIEQCGVEMSFLLMQYPNNRFVARQNVMYLNDVKCDPIEANKAIENIKKINRGIKIMPDTVHCLGMAAFPDLPEYSLTKSESSTETKILDNENYGTEELSVDDTFNIDAIEAINKQIKNHKVPAIRFAIWSSIICYLALVVVPLVGLMVYFQFFRKELQEPVIITEGIAKTEVTLSVLSGYVGRIFFRRVDDPKHHGKKIMDKLDIDYDFDYNAFGGFHRAIDILKYGTTQIAVSNAKISNIRKFKPDDPRMNKIRKLLFSKNQNFTLYFTKYDYHTTQASVNEITYMIANHIGKMYDWGSEKGQFWSLDKILSSESLTARHNDDGSLQAMGKSLDIMFEYFDELKKTYILSFRTLTITLCSLCVLTYSIVFVAQNKKIRNNRHEILYILTTLPKTMISNISASFSKLNKGETTNKTDSDLEINRQEESIIKLFGSISDGSSASAEIAAMLVTGMIVIFSCLAYYLILNDYIKTTSKVVGKTAHINHLYGCAAYLYNTMATLFKIALAKYHPVFEDTIVDLDGEINNYVKRVPLIINYFNALDFGNPEQGPFDGLNDVIEYATKAIVCHGKLEPPKKFLASVHCFSAPQQLHLAVALMKKYGSEMTQEHPIWPDPHKKLMSQLWQVGPMELYEVFFYKAGNEIVPLIFKRINEQQSRIIAQAVIFMIINALLTAVVITAAKYENEFFKFCLRLFLRCPPMSIFSNHRVMNLLSGNYNTKIEDAIDRHSSYYNEVVNKLDVIVIVASDETRKIIDVNNAFTQMFEIENEVAQNLAFDSFLAKVNFESDDEISKVFSSVINVKYRNAKGEIVYLEFSSVSCSGRRIIYATNQTQNVLHEKLIDDEKKKSDRMLSSILPASMVPRVQAGEKNISFAVQSVTVLFLDIVSFTPWCGSHDAQYVMRMLNIMFKELDAVTAAHKSMMKIKCIGDCYMAAGGIFDEVNQPAVHAKEVVDFGRLAILKLLEIDERENEKLQIRVGINTGGPIVAGVIGTEKPTFEILGPAINVAHEMEHHGVPMKVHISRPVYELIYGQQFEIKERGEIDVKGGKMFTYLVDP